MRNDPLSEESDGPSWIVAGFLPYEAEVRRWLRRAVKQKYDESDIIQEAYYRIWRRAENASVESPRSYFFTVARNIFFEQLRRDRVVRICDLTEMDAQNIPSEEPGADRQWAGRERLALVQSIIEELPDRCRNVIRLRRIQGESQRSTAKLLGISENIVEKEVSHALRHLLRRIGEIEDAEQSEHQQRHDDGRRRGKRS